MFPTFSVKGEQSSKALADLRAKQSVKPEIMKKIVEFRTAVNEKIAGRVKGQHLKQLGEQLDRTYEHQSTEQSVNDEQSVPIKDEQSKKAEQHKIDIQALHDARSGRKIRNATSEESWAMWSTWDSDIAQLSQKHPTLDLQQLYEILRYRKLGVPIEGAIKDEQSHQYTLADLQKSSRAEQSTNDEQYFTTEQRATLQQAAEALALKMREMQGACEKAENLEKLVEEMEADAKEYRAKLKKVEDEKRATEERTNAFIKKLQEENLELKEKLKGSEDVATLERSVVLLAQGVLNLKVSTEKKFKKLGKQVKKSTVDQKGAELQEELAQKQEEVEKLKDTVTCLEAQTTKQKEDGKEFHEANMKLKSDLLRKESEHQKEIDECTREIQKLEEKLEKTVEEKNQMVQEIQKMLEEMDEQSKDEQSSIIEQSIDDKYELAYDNMLEDIFLNF